MLGSVYCILPVLEVFSSTYMHMLSRLACVDDLISSLAYVYQYSMLNQLLLFSPCYPDVYKRELCVDSFA